MQERKEKYKASGICMAMGLQSAISFGLMTFEENHRFETSRASLIDLETELIKHNSHTIDYEKFQNMYL